MTFGQMVMTVALAAMTFVAPTPHDAPLAQDKPVPGANVLGDWLGIFDAGVAKLTLVLHITQDAPGALTGTLDSPAQNARGRRLVHEHRSSAMSLPPRA